MNQLEELKQILKGYQKVAIAYSGGCDSHFLYSVACDTLGKDHVLAILCVGLMMSKEDVKSARALLQDGQYEVIDIDVLSIDSFRYNRKDRCYHCKKMIMSQVIKKAREKGFHYVLDGMNHDDLQVYRPGRKACEELGILSPLTIMDKQTIRQYSKECNIETYQKPVNACLATRFPYDTYLSEEKLAKVDRIESLLHDFQVNHVRCRVHENLVRIEAEKKDFIKIINHPTLIEQVKEEGFEYVTLDLSGISSGRFDK